MPTKELLAETAKLNEAIERLLVAMAKADPISDEYAKLADQLTKLYKVKEIDTNFKAKLIDTFGKRKDAEAQQVLKELEVQSRQHENEMAFDLKTKENETSCRLKEQELALREREIAAKELDIMSNADQRSVDVDLKKRQIDLLGRVSVDTWAVIAANLIGIGIIIGYERVNVITSKAITFVSRLR